MTDPISIATMAFGAIKSGVEVGKKLTDLSGHIVRFVSQMSLIEDDHKKESTVTKHKVRAMFKLVHKVCRGPITDKRVF